MRTAVLTIPAQTARLLVPSPVSSLPVATASASLAMPGAAVSVSIPGATVGLQVGPWATATGILPHLDYCRLVALPGLTRASVISSNWVCLGQISYSAVRVSDSVRVATSAFYPAAPATSYDAAIILNGLTAGEAYRLDYWLNATPDVGGYTEGWVATDIFWTQPVALDPPIDDSFTSAP